MIESQTRAPGGASPRARHVYEGSPRWHRIGKATGVWRLFGNTLPPAINLRYLRYGRRCRMLSKGGASWTDWPFRDHDGIIVRQVITQERAASMVAKVSAALETGVLKPAKDPAFMVDVPKPLEFFGDGILDILDGPLGDTLERVMGSPFRVEWLQYYRALPGAPAKSWLWHIDNDPPYVVKVLIYLTDATRENGATHLLSGEETKTWFSRKYFGVYPSERREHLPGTEESDHVVTMAAGDTLVFSTNRLHKGGEVLRGFRDVLSFLILPSAIGWREDLKQRGVDYVHNASGYPANPAL